MVAAAMNHLATMKAKIFGEKAAANEDMQSKTINIKSDNLLPKLGKKIKKIFFIDLQTVRNLHFLSKIQL